MCRESTCSSLETVLTTKARVSPLPIATPHSPGGPGCPEPGLRTSLSASRERSVAPYLVVVAVRVCDKGGAVPGSSTSKGV